MRILIQNCKTKEFLTGGQNWAPQESSALDFGITAAALQYSTHLALEDVQVVMKFSEDRYDVRIPLADSCRERSAVGY